ncbi:MAG TPA: hypothetical protein VN946_05620 [Terriglobales bacterium]|jgi:hypothetical protein|nr:hypothetical protein [Terriglobales bacterium]
MKRRTKEGARSRVGQIAAAAGLDKSERKVLLDSYQDARAFFGGDRVITRSKLKEEVLGFLGLPAKARNEDVVQALRQRGFSSGNQHKSWRHLARMLGIHTLSELLKTKGGGAA